MKSKTWFLAPDFTFLPDGQLSLGSIIPEPRRPTKTLASLSSYSNIEVPEIRTIVEKDRSFNAEKSRSFGFNLLAKFVAIFEANASNSISWSKSESFSEVDHEVRAYNGAFTADALEKIVALPSVKKHIDSGRFGKRCVYIISGIRVVQQGFTVIEERESRQEVGIGGSGPVLAGAVEIGGGTEGSRQEKKTKGYETAPGIVFAYRVHVIRPRDEGADGELFSDRTAFFSGEAEEEEQEMEVVDVNGDVLRQDLDLDPDDFEEREISDDEDESYIVFKLSNK